MGLNPGGGARLSRPNFADAEFAAAVIRMPLVPKHSPLSVLFVMLALFVGPPTQAGPLDGPRLDPTEDLPPGLPGAEEEGAGTLADAIEAFSRGDLYTSRLHLQKLLRARKTTSTDRARGHFLLGWVSTQLGNYQQASANFYRVRKMGTYALTERAAFFEARADLLRGHPQTALAECGSYRAKWPEGPYADDCLLVQADAYIAQGKFGSAASRYSAFVAARPDDRRREPVKIRIAQALERGGRFKDAASHYRKLYLSHTLPTTSRIATAGLERMREAGYVTEEFTDEQLFRRALSLRRAAQFDASWELYSALDERNPGKGEDATTLGRKIDSSRHDFLWKNRKYAKVGQGSAWSYDNNPDHKDAPNRLHWAIEGLTRGGKYKKASKYLDAGRERFPENRRFKNTWERDLKVYEGAARYDDALAVLQGWQERSPSARTSSRNRFLIPYYDYRSKRYSEAIAGFTPIVNSKSKYRTAALYYRGKAKYRSGDRRGGRADHRQVLRRSPDSWYSVVLRSRYRRRVNDPDQMLLARNGRWPGNAAHETSLPAPISAGTPSEMVARGWDQARPGTEAPLQPDFPRVRDSDGRPAVQSFDGWSSPSLLSLGSGSDSFGLSRPNSEGDAGRLLPASMERKGGELRRFDPLDVPPTWEPSSRWSPELARGKWWRFSQDHQEIWPELPIAFELSQAGLYELAGPVLAQVYSEVRDLRKDKAARAEVVKWRASGGDEMDEEKALQLERWSKIMDLDLGATHWRLIFGAAGYPASVSAFALESVGFGSYSRLEPEGRAVWTLGYPAAFAPHVWRAAWNHDVDPLLMLAVMRVESHYRHDAISPAGAMGLVQVMPSTGHRVAALMGDPDFRVDRLLEPGVNITLGTFYMGRLMDRFGDAQFALAVGSYNGGPHNVGRWLQDKVGIPFEEFVEEIQFHETRAYTKRVIQYYAIYCQLYGDGAWVLLPERTSRDVPGVINF